MRKFTLVIVSILLTTFNSYSQVNVDVDSGGLLYISETSYVYVSGTGNVNVDTSSTPGDLVVNSTSTEYGQLFVGGTGSTGNVEYRLSVPQASVVRSLVSPPVTGVTPAQLASDNSNFANGNIPGSPADAIMFGPFDNSNTPYYYSEYSASDNTTTLISGVGYRAGTTDGATISFSGPLNNSTTGVDLNLTVASGTQFSSQNVVGNPYPTYLNADLIVDEIELPANAANFVTGEVAIYGWNGTGISVNSGISNGGNFGSTSLAGWSVINNTTPNSYLAPGQGFALFVSAPLTLNLARTTRDVTLTGDDFIAGRPGSGSSSVQSWDKFRVNIENESTSELINGGELFFIDNGVDTLTRGLDEAWDAKLLGMGSIGVATVLADDSQLTGSMHIQVMPLDDLTTNNDWVIPLSVKCNANTQYALSLERLLGNTPGDIYLEDKLTNTFTLVSDGTSYSFTSNNPLNGTGRFYLSKNGSSLGSDDNELTDLSVYSQNSTDSIVIEGVLNSRTNATLFDIQGRIIIADYKLDSSTQRNLIDVSSLSSGVYIVSLEDENGLALSKKLVID